MYQVLALSAVFGFSVAFAQTDQAKCTDSAWSWSKNSLGQDPCIVGQALGMLCSPDNSFTIPSLPAGYYYSGQNPQFATDCVCNTVYYSLVSVCGQCQDGYASPWPIWNGNCTVVYNTFPKTLPEGFPVPDWAYEPLLTNGTVNFAAAQNDNNPDSTAPPSPTFTNNGQGGSGGQGQGGSGSSGNSGLSSGGSKKKTNVGAIAGGVVGGVVGLALIGLLVFFLLRRRKPTTQRSEASTILAAPHPGHMSMISEKPYDPNDPTTYPTSPSFTTAPLSPPVSPGPTSYTSTPFVPGTPEPQVPQQTGPWPGQTEPGFMAPQQPNPVHQWAGQAPPHHPQFHGAAIPQV